MEGTFSKVPSIASHASPASSLRVGETEERGETVGAVGEIEESK